jgi:hypothetical protein
MSLPEQFSSVPAEPANRVNGSAASERSPFQLIADDLLLRHRRSKQLGVKQFLHHNITHRGHVVVVSVLCGSQVLYPVCHLVTTCADELPSELHMKTQQQQHTDYRLI